MRKLLLFVTLLALFASCSRVPAGNVGILFHSLGGEKGVDMEELGPGRYWVGVNDELFLFPTFNQNKTWTSDVREDSPVDEDFNFQSMKGLELSASVGIEYHIPKENVPMVFQKYKKGVNEITDKVLRNALREAFNIASSTRESAEMYGEGKVDFLTEIDSIAKVHAKERGIVIDDIYLIGNINIPESVRVALNLKIEADQIAQQKQTEIVQATADAAKKVEAAKGDSLSYVIRAAGQAEANRILAASITNGLIEYNSIERWNGVYPQVVSDAGVLTDLRTK